MKMNAALCFVLASAALRGWYRELRIQNVKSRKRIQFLVFGITFLTLSITSFTLIEYGFNINLGIDQLLIQ